MMFDLFVYDYYYLDYHIDNDIDIHNSFFHDYYTKPMIIIMMFQINVTKAKTKSYV